MPNWIRNIVTVEAPNAERLKEFRNLVESEENVFEFNRIIPMPETMNIVTDSLSSEPIAIYLEHLKHYDPDGYDNLPENIRRKYRMTDDIRQVYARALRETKSNGLVLDCRTHPLSAQDYVDYGRTYLTNLMKYGAVSWYDWSVNNWGTKWDSCEAWIATEADNHMEYVFDTAWAPPRGIYEELNRRFPDFKFTVQYADEDALSCHCGTMTFEGDHQSEDCPVSEHESLIVSCEVWGWDYEESKEMYGL